MRRLWRRALLSYQWLWSNSGEYVEFVCERPADPGSIERARFCAGAGLRGDGVQIGMLTGTGFVSSLFVAEVANFDSSGTQWTAGILGSVSRAASSEIR